MASLPRHHRQRPSSILAFAAVIFLFGSAPFSAVVVHAHYNNASAKNCTVVVMVFGDEDCDKKGNSSDYLGCCLLADQTCTMVDLPYLAESEYFLVANCTYQSIALDGDKQCAGDPTITWGGNVTCGSLAPVLSFASIFPQGNSTLVSPMPPLCQVTQVGACAAHTTHGSGAGGKPRSAVAEAVKGIVLSRV